MNMALIAIGTRNDKLQKQALAVAKKINRIDVYKQAATAVGGINLPSGDMRSSTLMDGKVWDGSNPAEYANSFAMKR